MITIEQCRFCEHLNPKDKSFYGESFRCTKNHKFVDPLSRCNEFLGSGTDKLREMLKGNSLMKCISCDIKMDKLKTKHEIGGKTTFYKCPKCGTITEYYDAQKRIDDKK